MAEILDRRKSVHQQLVEQFMELAGQELPARPSIPSDATRLLRAKLIFEEALETINALGVRVSFWGSAINVGHTKKMAERLGLSAYGTFHGETVHPHEFEIAGPADLHEVVDGCADVKVVTTGTLSSFGVADESVQEAVDRSNLDKFVVPGGYRRDDGKWEKGPNWRPPDWGALLGRQGYQEA